MNELKICGMSAVKARFARDAASIQRLYFDYQTGRKIGIMAKALAAARRIYRCVEPSELEKIAGTVHHGGVVAVVATPVPLPVRPGDPAAWARHREPVLVLDRIGNAHNLGALARTAAFFGVPRLILVDDPAAARPNDAAYRVAEGGFEFLQVHAATDLPGLLRALAEAGYTVIGASVHSSTSQAGKVAQRVGPVRRSLGEGGDRALHLPSPPVPPNVVVLGNEEHGLSPAVEAACTRLATLPGSGRIESLNVSAAGAVLIWEYLRPPPPGRGPSRPAQG